MRFVFLAVFFAGCGLSLDLSPEDPGRGDGAVTIDAGIRDGSVQDAPGADAPDGGVDAEVDAFMVPDAGMCSSVADCEGRPRSGAETSCAPWACEGGFCVENDYDGDGYGPGCADERDCDDFDPSVTFEGIVSCPTAPPGVCGASAYRECRDGVVSDTCEGVLPPLREVCNGEDDDCDGAVDDGIASETVGAGRCASTLACVGGAWTSSAPMPAAVDGCEGASEGVDDDCDGSIDEDCAPSDCVFVRPGATMGDGSAAAPVPTLNAAFMVATERGLDTICLLATGSPATCSPTTHRMPAAEVPRSLTVVGGLVASAGGVSRCPTGPEATTLAPAGSLGIVISSGITLTLRDLVVSHPMTTGSSAVALDVRGAATLAMSNVRVRGGTEAGLAGTRRGVRVASGGTLVAAASRIEAGPGNTTYAIDSTGGNVRLVAGCGPLGCAPDCSDRNHGVFSTHAGSTVRLNGGSFLAERVAFCGDNGTDALLVQGASTTLLRSLVQIGPTPTDSAYGVRVDSCASFWMHDTIVRVAVAGAERVYDSLVGVDVAGGCAALFTENVIEGVRTFSSPEVVEAVGVRCVGADCFVVDNAVTANAAGGGTLEATALWCESGCGYVALNELTGALFDAEEAFGLLLDGSDAAVTRNRAVGGCGGLVVGARVSEGAPRFTSNEVVGSVCNLAAPGFATGLALEGTSGGDFSSNGNSYDGGRVPTSAECSAAGVALASSTRFGTFRNDVFVAGECLFARAFLARQEAPRFFTHNGFVGDYYEALVDVAYTTADDLRTDYPLFVGHVFTNAPGFRDRPTSLRIGATSPFAGRGTRLGAPPVDFDGRPRPSPPSMGAWEP